MQRGEGVPDFVLMDALTEDALFHNLKLRYGKDKIYVRKQTTKHSDLKADLHR